MLELSLPPPPKYPSTCSRPKTRPIRSPRAPKEPCEPKEPEVLRSSEGFDIGNMNDTNMGEHRGSRVVIGNQPPELGGAGISPVDMRMRSISSPESKSPSHHAAAASGQRVTSVLFSKCQPLCVTGGPGQGDQEQQWEAEAALWLGGVRALVAELGEAVLV